MLSSSNDHMTSDDVGPRDWCVPAPPIIIQTSLSTDHYPPIIKHHYPPIILHRAFFTDHYPPIIPPQNRLTSQPSSQPRSACSMRVSPDVVGVCFSRCISPHDARVDLAW